MKLYVDKLNLRTDLCEDQVHIVFAVMGSDLAQMENLLLAQTYKNDGNVAVRNISYDSNADKELKKILFEDESMPTTTFTLTILTASEADFANHSGRLEYLAAMAHGNMFMTQDVYDALRERQKLTDERVSMYTELEIPRDTLMDAAQWLFGIESQSPFYDDVVRETSVSRAINRYCLTKLYQSIPANVDWVSYLMDNCDMGLDTHGRFVIRTKASVVLEDCKDAESVDAGLLRLADRLKVSIREMSHAAFLGAPFICMQKDDLNKLYEWLSEYVFWNGANDNKALGETGLSFERLSDAITGSIFPYSMLESKPRSEGRNKIKCLHKAAKASPTNADEKKQSATVVKTKNLNHVNLILEPASYTEDMSDLADEEWALVCRLFGCDPKTTVQLSFPGTTEYQYIIDEGEDENSGDFKAANSKAIEIDDDDDEDEGD